jgi:hypothetical protein
MFMHEQFILSARRRDDAWRARVRLGKDQDMAIDGKWNLTINTPMGAQSSTLEVASSGGALTGRQIGAQGANDIDNGTVNGDEASWSIDIVVPMPMTLTFKGKVEGDKLSGTVTLGAFGDSTFMGERA